MAGPTRTTAVRTAVAAVLVTLFITPSALAATSVVEPVVNTANFEYAPSGGGGYVTYASNSEAHPRHYNTYLLPDGGTPIRINEEGTGGATAGIDGDTVVYEQDGDLMLYDIPSATRSAVPAGINTDMVEGDPSMSGEWLLFGRYDFSLRRVPSWVILHNLTTGEDRILAHGPGYSMFAEQVNGLFVAYTDGVHEFRYDIAADTTTEVPGTDDGKYGAGSIESDGTLYAVWGPFGCGGGYEIRRFDTDSTLTTIYVYPQRRQVAWKTFAVETDAGATNVLFDSLNCRTFTSNIFRLDDADTATGPSTAVRIG